jgi:hypothetical protein
MLFALALVLVATVGWSGPPPAPGDASGLGPQPGAGQMPGAGDVGGGQGVASGFDATGGAGTGSMAGGDSGSPEIDLKDLGFRSTFTYQFRGAYNFGWTGVPVSVMADYAAATFTGDGRHSGPSVNVPTTPIANGDRLSGNYIFSRYGVTVDFDAAGMAGAGNVSAGPRLTWMNYARQLELTNSTQSWESNGAKGFSCLGFGGFININLAGAASAFGSSASLISPILKLSGSFGTGSSARYSMMEAALQLVKVKSPDSMLSDYSVPTPAIKGEIAYQIGQVTENTDGDVPSGWVPLPGQTNPLFSHLNVRYDALFLRGTLSF